MNGTSQENYTRLNFTVIYLTVNVFFVEGKATAGKSSSFPLIRTSGFGAIPIHMAKDSFSLTLVAVLSAMPD